MGAGGICPVLSCDDALVTLGMDEIWPIGDTHEDGFAEWARRGRWVGANTRTFCSPTEMFQECSVQKVFCMSLLAWVVFLDPDTKTTPIWTGRLDRRIMEF